MDKRLERYRTAIDAIEEIAAADTSADVFSKLQSYTRHIGGTSLIIGRVVNPILAGRRIDSFGMSDWPESWSKTWIEEDLILQDPVTRHAMRAKGIFDWSDAHREAPVRGNRILEEGRAHGFERGIAIPITVGMMPMGLVSVGYETEIDPDDIKHLELVASHAYVSVLEVMDNGNEDELPIVPLTPREMDVLSFTAIGKSAWEISRIYTISESTVKKHLASINRKLGTANKSHAVATALRSGQILL